MNLSILGLTISVVFVDELSGANADFNGDLLRIRLVRGLPKDVLCSTLAHELVHLKQWVYGHEMCEDEANRDALFWMTFLRSSSAFRRVWKAYTE